MVAGDREPPWRANAPRYECDRSAAELGDGGSSTGVAYATCAGVRKRAESKVFNV